MIIPNGFSIKPTLSGKGLFTDINIENNTLVALEDDYFLDTIHNVSKYAMEVYTGVFLDHKMPHYLNFVNHSCKPNMRYDLDVLGFFSVSNITAGSEITFDYDTTQSDMVYEGTWFFCNCDFETCRKIIKGNYCIQNQSTN